MGVVFAVGIGGPCKEGWFWLGILDAGLFLSKYFIKYSPVPGIPKEM